jgi:hypothetical protein
VTENLTAHADVPAGARVHPVGGRALDQAVTDALLVAGCSIRAGVESSYEQRGSMAIDSSVDGSGSGAHSSVLEYRTSERARALKVCTYVFICLFIRNTRVIWCGCRRAFVLYVRPPL